MVFMVEKHKKSYVQKSLTPSPTPKNNVEQQIFAFFRILQANSVEISQVRKSVLPNLMK